MSNQAIGKIESFSGEYRWLSNFWPCPIFFEGIGYQSTEAAYQAAKTIDERVRLVISQLPRPGDTKKFARKMPKRNDWDDVKLKIMEEVLRYKFSSLELRAKLLATGDQEIIEGNTWGDVFWGVCNGKGENNLGKFIMKIRSELAGENQ